MNTAATATVALSLCAGPAIAQTTPQPPITPTREHLTDWHGEKVNDPWFWLREKDSPPVLEYLKAENAYTEAATKDLAPMTGRLYKEMLGRIKETDLDVPVRRGTWYYYSRTMKGLQYPIRCRRPATAALPYDAKAPEQVLIDLNTMAKGKAFISLGDMKVSDDAAWLLFTTDDTGFRQYKLFRKNLATGEVEGPLAERVSSLEWAADNRTLFFTTEDAVTKRSDTLWRLAPGGAPERLLMENDELFSIGLGRTKDRRYLVLQSYSTDTWESRLLDARQPGGTFGVVLPRERGHKYDIDHREGVLYIRTNRDAKDFRIVTAPLADPRPINWKPFVDHRPGVLVQDLEVFKDFLVVSEKSEGLSRFRVQKIATGVWRELPFKDPVYAAASGHAPEYDTTAFRYTYQSLVTPPSVYELDMKGVKPKLLKRQPVLGGYDPKQYVSERLWATARDGTRVPLSIVYRKDRPRDGKGALWLYAYGSYGYGMPATFSSARLSLLDRGVAYAIAHIRGGNEMGETWHDDGMLMKKKNTFLDFIDSAEYLVKAKWVAKDRLAIEGGSAGGLLMGAVTNLRPDLFRAVHSAVPFVDVMNTMTDASLPLTVGEYLEWGNPNEKLAFDYMRSYSPYDNLQKKAYPPILVTTSYNDSQVMYWEPAKYVAKLR
ncbi:MAG: S9 family peptidase, partial [Chloroflexota bacterium]